MQNGFSVSSLESSYGKFQQKYQMQSSSDPKHPRSSPHDEPMRGNLLLDERLFLPVRKPRNSHNRLAAAVKSPLPSSKPSRDTLSPDVIILVHVPSGWLDEQVWWCSSAKSRNFLSGNIPTLLRRPYRQSYGNIVMPWRSSWMSCRQEISAGGLRRPQKSLDLLRWVHCGTPEHGTLHVCSLANLL